MDAFGVYRAWWSDAPGRHSPETARTYRGLVHRTLADLGEDPRKITARTMRDYLDGWRTQHAKAIRTAMGDLFGWMVQKGHRRDNPLEDVPARRLPRRRRRIKRSLTEEELARLLVSLVYHGPYRRRWGGQEFAWKALAFFYSGARPGEFLRLTPQDVYLNGRTSHVYLDATKTDSEREVPLGQRGREAFAEALRRSNGRLVTVGRTQFWQRIRSAALAAGIDERKCRPYALRHTFARLLSEAGVPLEDIAELMGHEDIRTTREYTVGSREALRRAVELLP